MNKQRKVLITVTYNDLGMIVDTKAEELDSSAQPERPEQPESAREYCAECNHIEMCRWYPYEGCEFRSLPSAQPEITLEQIEEYCRPRCLSIITNDMLWHLEQRQPKRTGEWIPYSQKLPKEDEYVLICFEDDPKEKWYCRMAVGWLEDGFWQCWDDRASTRMDVVAWMPLPEPFKGGEDRETDQR